MLRKRLFIAMLPALISVMLHPAALVADSMPFTWGLAVIRSILQQPGNVVVPLKQWRLDGFREEPGTVRVPYVQRTADHGCIAVMPSVNGLYYPGFVIYDSAGREEIEIRIQGAKRGLAVADADDNREHLYFLPGAVRLRRGEEISLCTATGEGAYRVESIVLMKEKPAAKPLPYDFTDMTASANFRGEHGTAELSWISSWPTRCTVEVQDPAGSTPRTITESSAERNHRVVVRHLSEGKQYKFRLIARTRDGRPVTSPWQDFSMNLVPAPLGTTELGSVRLTIHDPANPDAAGDFPVTSGLPFARGVLGSDRQLRALSPDGREIPLQTRVLAWWPDRSIKWVLLDFQAGAASAGPYSIEYGKRATRKAFPSRLRVIDTEDAVNVSTGRIRFRIDKRGNGLMSRLAPDGGKELLGAKGITLSLTGMDNTLYSAELAPERVKIEESGPMRVTIRMQGHYRARNGRQLFAFDVRLSAFAGEPYLRLTNTWGNDNGGPDFTSIRSLKLTVPLRSAGQQEWRLGTAPQEKGTLDPGASVRLQQHTDNRFTIIGSDGGSPVSGKRAAGWAEWSRGGQRVTLAIRDFWQTYPKDIALTHDGMELDICPPLKPDEYRAAKGTVDEHRLYYYLQNGVYKFRQGMSQTQDIWLGVASSKDTAAAAILDRQTPLRAIAPLAWYARSKVFDHLAPTASSGILADYDKSFALGFEQYWLDRERDREYGMLNFGDWWGERKVDWGNSEYDYQNAFLLQFLRTGIDRYFEAAEQMEWHNRDVDTIHYHADKSRIGGVYHHAIGHTGGYYKVGEIPGNGITVGILTVDHVFNRGHLAYYLLTGDSRSLETALAIADRYDTVDTRAFDFDSCRNAGWHLILTMAAFNATGDPFYLNAARIILERVIDRQTPDGGWDYYRVCVHKDEPQHYGNFGFTVGILLTGLRMYYDATGDEVAAAQIIQGARWMAARLYDPKTGDFRYSSCPSSPPATALSFLLLDGITFTERRTGDPQLRELLIKASRRTLERMNGLDEYSSHWRPEMRSKELGYFVCNALHFLGYVAKLAAEQSMPGARLSDAPKR